MTAWKREDSQKCCKNCEYWIEEPIDHGFVCVNSDSIFCADWREEDDSCEVWKRKEYATEKQ